MTLQRFLARLYVDAELRAAFLADPAAATAELGDGDRAALAAIDRVGLELAARSFAGKRAHQDCRRRSWLARLLDR